jgi:hypothetical protein
MQTPASRVIILRHDVDRRPGNALKTARLEHDPGIPASCYFRAVPESWDEAGVRLGLRVTLACWLIERWWGQSCVIAFLRKGPQKHNNTRLTPG